MLRSFIAARSSAVNPSDFRLAAVVLPVELCAFPSGLMGDLLVGFRSCLRSPLGSAQLAINAV